MARLTTEILLPRVPHRPAIHLPGFIRAILFAGIRTDDPRIRRRQLFTNILAYVAAVNALLHLVINSLHDLSGLAVINAYNAAILLFFAFNHRLHALGDLVAAVTLILGVVFGHSFIVFALGTASDLHVYFTLAGFILFIVGVENMRAFIALYSLGLAALLAAFFFAPEYGFVQTEDIELRRSLAFQSLMNAFVMNGVLITFALTALHRAEAALTAEHERSEALLTTILPRHIAERLKASRDRRIADRIDGCSVLFIDLVGFTEATNRLEPGKVVEYLDGIFSRFDAICEQFGVDKIKTIGDSYMAVAGLEGDAGRGARAIGLAALAFREVIDTSPQLGAARPRMRGGIHCGPVTAGIIGDIRMSYDVWGDTVNTASRMESHGLPGRIHVSEPYRRLATPWFDFEPRGEIEVKSLGSLRTHFLIAARVDGHEAEAAAAPDEEELPDSRS